MKKSRLSRDARIETLGVARRRAEGFGRVSHGTRGLKHAIPYIIINGKGSRVSHGTRGLKRLGISRKRNRPAGRVSHGTRGLKLERRQ